METVLRLDPGQRRQALLAGLLRVIEPLSGNRLTEALIWIVTVGGKPKALTANLEVVTVGIVGHRL